MLVDAQSFDLLLPTSVAILLLPQPSDRSFHEETKVFARGDNVVCSRLNGLSFPFASSEESVGEVRLRKCSEVVIESDFIGLLRAKAI